MANFEESLKIVLAHEGGYQNNPNDLSGGSTNKGITQKDLSEYLKRPATDDDIRNIPDNVVWDLYKLNYWDKLRLDEVKCDIVATVIFDLCVVRGMHAVVKDLQTILKVQVDGIMGPDTLEELNTYETIYLCVKLLEAAQSCFSSICSFNRNQIVFLGGWLNRTHSLLDYTLGL